MSESRNSGEPIGEPSGTAAQGEDERSLGGHCRRIQHDAGELAAAVQAATNDLERYLTEQVEARPYATLGVAVGVGYVLGGGLRSRMTTALLGAATRVAVALAARELSVRLWPDASANTTNKTS